eukprot:9479503-Pyramimonas_sp.AAC.1
MHKSGVSENSFVARVLRDLAQIVRLEIGYDQIRSTNLVCIEQAVLGFHAIQQVQRDPSSEGLNIDTFGSYDEIGWARLHGYDTWPGHEQREEAKTMEVQRKWREVLAAERCSSDDRDGPPDLKSEAKAKASPAGLQEGRTS